MEDNKMYYILKVSKVDEEVSYVWREHKGSDIPMY